MAPGRDNGVVAAPPIDEGRRTFVQIPAREVGRITVAAERDRLVVEDQALAGDVAAGS